MKRIKVLFSAFLILALFASVGFAAEGDSNFTNIVVSGDVTVGDDVIATGDITVRSTLMVNGLANGGALIKQSSSTSLSTAELAYSVIKKRVGGLNGLDNLGVGSVLDNGTPGQVIHLVVILQESGGSWDITPTTATGFTTITLNAVGESATLLYVDSTIGWIVTGSTGASIA